MEPSTVPKSILNYLMLSEEGSNVEPFNQISNYPLDSTYNTKLKNPKNKLNTKKNTLYKNPFLSWKKKRKYYKLYNTKEKKNKKPKNKEKIHPSTPTNPPKEAVWLTFYINKSKTKLKKDLLTIQTLFQKNKVQFLKD